MGNTIKAKNGDLIKIINTRCASWLKKGEIYYVGDSGYMQLYNRDKTPIWYDNQDFICSWGCDTTDYEIITNVEDHYEIY